MKYVKTYSTKSAAVADTTVKAPMVGFCVENSQVMIAGGALAVDTAMVITEDSQTGNLVVSEVQP